MIEDRSELDSRNACKIIKHEMVIYGSILKE